MRLMIAALALLVAAATSGWAQDTAAPTITIDHAWSRASVTKTGIAYLTVHSTSPSADRLVSASTPIAERAELHQTLEDKGVMKMRSLDSLAIAPGSAVQLKPNGAHLMLLGLKAPLKAGQTFPLTLIFEKAGTIETTVSVEKAGSMGGMQHDMSEMH